MKKTTFLLLSITLWQVKKNVSVLKISSRTHYDTCIQSSFVYIFAVYIIYSLETSSAVTSCTLGLPSRVIYFMVPCLAARSLK